MEFLEGIVPREYQKKIFETCQEKNCLVVLPTGLGKTLIALMLVINRMKKFPGEKVVFVAPTRPLAEQHLATFTKHLPELFADIQLFTGKINAKNRQKIWNTADIIFSTPQCVANDIRHNLYNLNEVCLLVEDEAHRCVKNYDYNFLAKKYKEQSMHPRILGLTASPGSNKLKIKQICKNLFVEEVELRTRNSQDVKNYLQELKFEKVMVNFPPEFEEVRYILKEIFDKYIEELKNRRVLWGPASKTGLINLQKKLMATLGRGNRNFNYMLGVSACAQAIKLQHALELLETQTLSSFNKYLKDLFNQARQKKSKGVVKLVSKPQFNFVFTRTNELLAKGFEHPKINELKDIIKKERLQNKKLKVIVFAQFRDTTKFLSDELNNIQGIKSQVFVGQTKKEGMGLSQKEQKKMIEDFSNGNINVLCATSIGEEGLDIPEVNTVIFYEPVPSAIRKIQRSGRTARLMKGKLIMLVTKGTRDEAFYYVSRAKEKSMQSAMSSIKEELSNKKEKQKELF
jgi:Fanconi anemia group M protein